jgi:hypothetical protein
MKFDPKTARFILEMVATLATVAAGVIGRYYIDCPAG